MKNELYTRLFKKEEFLDTLFNMSEEERMQLCYELYVDNMRYNNKNKGGRKSKYSEEMIDYVKGCIYDSRNLSYRKISEMFKEKFGVVMGHTTVAKIAKDLAKEDSTLARNTRGKNGGRKSLSDENIQFIEEQLLSCNKELSYRIIAEMYKEKFNEEISHSTIYKVAKRLEERKHI